MGNLGGRGLCKQTGEGGRMCSRTHLRALLSTYLFQFKGGMKCGIGAFVHPHLLRLGLSKLQHLYENHLTVGGAAIDTLRTSMSS